MGQPLLHVDDLECRYGATVVTRQVNFSLTRGDLCCLLGPSGCGKTTLLRAIAGFEPVAAGSIALDGRVLSDPTTLVAPEKRQIGMVFQDYALFPHLSIVDNVAFGLRRLPGDQRRQRVDELLELVGLTHLGKRYPHELSGGQQQRVALARALAPQPRLLLLDEPFSNLDVELRRQLSQEVRRILKKLGISAIMVTHDQQEAFALADQVGVLHGGHLQQWDTPYNLYHEPATRFVANFIGQGFFIPGTMQDRETVNTEIGDIAGNRAYPFEIGAPVDVLLRPDDIVLDQQSALEARVEQRTFTGASTLYRLRLPSQQVVEASFNSHHEFAPGESIPVRIQADHLILFERRMEE
ncbi:iron(III) transport system ATP-binding protein [Modicisalibacter ilicicola DSM 19980]|uniref:Iron(III) transport system ATP-binding protein n=1 Tax=Modicisalibacter ilicicola DSM 19980 TaxID=1121942 RepID=A0A1M4ZDV5_9GAMM|nr:ABC transporter ATP-binding protein [Halomonas ilicicola]SHF15987.1 iron(III) transport system ATP-binding protein [Halomonas ilicicola DSM 19980]